MASPSALSRTLMEDWSTAVARDPSLTSRWQALGHPGLSALWVHRIAHRLEQRRLRTPARFLARAARRRTGVEIHPGATLGRRVFIDHGASVVIGQTAVVGDDVTLYHQVTLGAVGWWTDNQRPPGARRHPVIGDGVVLGAGATVLGPVTIGDHALIGATATVTGDLPPGARVYAARPTIHTAPAPTSGEPPSTLGAPGVPGTSGVSGAVGSAAPGSDAIRSLASAGSW
ncbi:serine O-acetyltransferase EpsC [Streptomyces sp. NPDC057638]|uniref:serine O-acetyltransferase EpsC n=1 Tax=Streptomyces sp. NPDC057638 TaxID=3346190 RepID=UPI0036876E8A